MFLDSGPSIERALSLYWWIPWCSCNVKKKKAVLVQLGKLKSFCHFKELKYLRKPHRKLCPVNSWEASRAGAALWKPWITSALLITRPFAWWLLQPFFWAHDIYTYFLSEVGCGGRSQVMCTQYSQILDSNFNFKTVLRISYFSSLADETKLASYQIASIHLSDSFYSLCMSSRSLVKLVWLLPQKYIMLGTFFCLEVIWKKHKTGWPGQILGGSCTSQQ